MVTNGQVVATLEDTDWLDTSEQVDQALVVESVPHVGSRARHVARSEEAGELGLPERIEELELAALLEVMLDVQVSVFQELHGSPSPPFR